MKDHGVKPLGRLLTAAAAAHPDRDAMVLVDERATYAELVCRAKRAGRSLMALGVEPGDRVGILMANCLDFVDILFGTTLIGAVPVLYNARFKAREIAHVTADAGVKVVVTNDIVEQHTNYVELLRRSLPGLAEHDAIRTLALKAAPDLRTAVTLSSSSTAGFLNRNAFYELGSTHPEEVVDERGARVRPEDVAVMIYTSGTTAMPKGCPLTHIVLQHAGVVGGVERLGLIEGDVMWAPLPMFHTAFTQPLTGILHVGGTFLSMTHFDAAAALRMIHDEQATVMFPAFPTITMQLLDHPSYTAQSFACVRVAINVGPPEELCAMQERMPHTTQITVFGMTETGGSAAMCERDDSLAHRTETSGFALPGNEIQIRDPDSGAELPAGERGEIVVRGRGVFSGYHKAPEKTAESFYDGGWFRTGDLGVMDADGRVTFRGRLKDMLKVGGENVAAVEVEGFLATHPAVNLAQVVAVPDDKYGEVPAAFVELAPGASASEQEIIDYCKDEIASFKIPRFVRFVEEWPMGATKILKYELRERICSELGL